MSRAARVCPQRMLFGIVDRLDVGRTKRAANRCMDRSYASQQPSIAARTSRVRG